MRDKTLLKERALIFFPLKYRSAPFVVLNIGFSYKIFLSQLLMNWKALLPAVAATTNSDSERFTMFNFLKDHLSGFTSGDSGTKNLTSSENTAEMSKNNKHGFGFKNFKVKRKDVVEELSKLTTKWPYSRPVFLGLRSEDELRITLEHAERRVTLPKISSLPRFAGYAE